MTGLIMTAQLLVGLSLLVFVHELGHFLAAKYFGMRVNRFYIFFDAWGKKLWSKKIGETEYGIGWLPLGGYVQIAGMIDETQDAKSLSAEPEEWEFRAKPAWQRFIVMIGGIVMNVITGILIFAMFLYSFEQKYLPVEEVNKEGIYAFEGAQKVGIQTGDKILAIDGQTPSRYKDIASVMTFLGSSITVERNDKIMDIQLPDDFFNQMRGGQFIGLMREEVGIGGVLPNSAADKAGLQKGDKIVAVNQQKVDRFATLQTALEQAKGTTTKLQIERGGTNQIVTAQVDTTGKLGFFPELDYPYNFTNYNLLSAFQYSFKEGYDLIASQVISFGLLFNGKLKATESLASPIGIAQIYGGVWDWARFWRITGLLSFVLAFMNILPIPALDGGHMVFLTYEMITGHRLSDEFLEKAQIFGFVLLMGIMVFAFGNDIYKLF